MGVSGIERRGAAGIVAWSRRLLAAAAVWAAACSGADDGSGGPQPSARSTLASSLEVAVGATTVELTLHLTNVGSKADTLSFPTAQRYEFAVLDSTGSPVWRWSDGRMFAQQVGREVLESGETLTYTAEWAPGGRVGRYTAVAGLADGEAGEVRRQFDLPGG